jgi:hypothetical protein
MDRRGQARTLGYRRARSRILTRFSPVAEIPRAARTGVGGQPKIAAVDIAILRSEIALTFQAARRASTGAGDAAHA